MVVQEQSATALPVDVTACSMSPDSRWRATTLMAYSAPMPKVIGRAMKFRKVIFTSAKPAAPTIQTTPSNMVATVSRAGAQRPHDEQDDDHHRDQRGDRGPGPVVQDGADHRGEHDRAARGLEGLAQLGQLQPLQHGGDAQQVLPAPDREPCSTG